MAQQNRVQQNFSHAVTLPPNFLVRGSRSQTNPQHAYPVYMYMHVAAMGKGLTCSLSMQHLDFRTTRRKSRHTHDRHTQWLTLIQAFMYVHVAQLGEYWGTNIRSSTVIMLMHVPSLLHRQTDTLYWWLVSSALTVFWVFLPRDDSSSSSPPRKDDLRPDRKEEMRHGGVDESRERKGGVGGEGGRRRGGRGRNLKTTLTHHT